MTTIERVLAETGLRQAELASLLGVTPACVSHWRSGQRVPAGGNRVLLDLLATGALTVADVRRVTMGAH